MIVPGYIYIGAWVGFFECTREGLNRGEFRSVTSDGEMARYVSPRGEGKGAYEKKAEPLQS